MVNSSPSPGSTTVGTAERGVRSEHTDCAWCSVGLPWTLGGDEDRMPVAEVGTGVGYLCCASRWEGEETACRFVDRGRPGEEDRGSKAGSRDGAGRLAPATGGSVGRILTLLGLSSIMAAAGVCTDRSCFCLLLLLAVG